MLVSPIVLLALSCHRREFISTLDENGYAILYTGAPDNTLFCVLFIIAAVVGLFNGANVFTIIDVPTA